MLLRGRLRGYFSKIWFEKASETRIRLKLKDFVYISTEKNSQLNIYNKKSLKYKLTYFAILCLSEVFSKKIYIIRPSLFINYSSEDPTINISQVHTHVQRKSKKKACHF